MTLVTRMFFTDAVSRDRERERDRQRVLEERNRIRMMTWADPGDAELKLELERLEEELRAFDRGDGRHG